MATSESETSGKAKMTREKRGVPGGLWLRCDDCGETIFRKEAEQLMSVCPECGYHMYLSAPQRVRWVLDEGTFEEWDATLSPTDPLAFRDKKSYAERVKMEQARTGMRDAALTGTGMIRARRVAFGVTDSAFIMADPSWQPHWKSALNGENGTTCPQVPPTPQPKTQKGPSRRIGMAL